MALWLQNPSRAAAEVMGAPLPPGTADVRFQDAGGMFGGDYYVSARMTPEQYRSLVRKLGLRHRPDLLEQWPTALAADGVPWWTVSRVNDRETFFGDAQDSTYVVTRYEDGRLFFRRHVY